MSTPTNGQAAPQKQANALPEPQQAYDHLFRNVHANVFFTKLASRGYYPQNEKEASDLLELAGKLRVANQNPRVKQASAPRSSFAGASADLDRLLGNMGVDTTKHAAQEEEASIKAAAAQLLNDPAIYNSVLSLKAAEADQIAAAMNLPRQ